MVHRGTIFVDTWRTMERLIGTGKVRAIDVSNFSRWEIEALLEEMHCGR